MIQKHIEDKAVWSKFCGHFQCIFLNENCSNLIKIFLKIVPTGSINNEPALIQKMAWHQTGDAPLSEPMTA